MRQIRIAKSERVDRCPICQQDVSDIGYTHINLGAKGHIKYNTSKCRYCEIDLVERDGQWRTSKLSWEELGTEIDIELAKEIYDVHEFNNQGLAEEYGMSLSDFNDMAQELWDALCKKIKPEDRIFTWKQENNHGLAVLRKQHIIILHQFDS